jgi:AraC-like DNA-binding protein
MTKASGRLVFGAVTVAVSEHRAGAVRTAGVAAGRMRLFVVRGGTLEMPSREGMHRIPEGHGAVVTGTASVQIASKDGCEVISIGMPFDGLSDLTLPKNAVILLDDEGMLRPIGAFVQALHESRDVAVLTRDHVGSMLHAMLSAAVRRAAAEVAAPPSTVAQRASAIIRQQCADPALTPAVVAAALNMSLRQLEREFLREGRTIRQEVRRIRVATAAALLKDGAHSARSIDAIAVQVGLSNGSSLARAMAAEGMASPARMRAGAARHRRAAL